MSEEVLGVDVVFNFSAIRRQSSSYSEPPYCSTDIHRSFNGSDLNKPVPTLVTGERQVRVF